MSATEITQRWLESIVIGLNLCPFAKRELLNNSLRFKESGAQSAEQLLQDLIIELALLNQNTEIETTIIIAPGVLHEFADYNQFLDFADSVITQMKLDGVFQIASFHPEYQFADAQVDDVENYTNRSPFPLLHILREESLEKAIQQHPDTGSIPENNIRLMRSLGLTHMQDLLAACQEATIRSDN